MSRCNLAASRKWVTFVSVDTPDNALRPKYCLGPQKPPQKSVIGWEKNLLSMRTSRTPCRLILTYLPPLDRSNPRVGAKLFRPLLVATMPAASEKRLRGGG